MTIQRSIKRAAERQASAGAVATVAIALGAFVACGSGSGTTRPDGATASSSSSTSSSGASGTSSGSLGDPTPGAPLPAPGSSSGNPNETVSCDVAAAQAKCTLDASDATPFTADDVFLTTDASCKTSLYAVGGGKLRRYTLKSGGPCAWDRDNSLADTAAGTLVAADDAGDVLTADTDITLIANGHATKCGTTPDGFQGAALTISRDGTVGFYGYVKIENGGAGANGISKIAITAAGCTATELTLTGEPLSVITGMALDTKGRLHVADDGDVPPAAHRVAIYEADGTLASSYQREDATNDFPQTAGITACKGGMCVDAFGSLVSVDENGVPRGAETYAPLESMAGLIRVLGTTRGPLFVAGDSNDGARTLIVETMKQPVSP